MTEGAWRPISASEASQTVTVDGFPAPGPRRDGAARFTAELVRGDRWDVRSFGSSLSLAYLATGKVAACVFFGAPPLHVAAGIALAREAGATITDLSGAPWTIGSPTLLAAAGAGLGADLATIAGTTAATG
jgi:fructose-1,6-bisphosphatase/inositol monophosphatase family enzyme